MKTLMAVLILILSACTTYDIKRDSEGIVSVHVVSTRSFEAPDLHYKRVGSDVEFDFEAANVDANVDAFVSMFQMFQQMLLQMQVPE